MRNIFLFSCLFFIVGCTQTPSELRHLHPVTITVLDNGQPMAGVFVTLSAKTPQEELWACNGTTDGSGIAKLRTKIRSFVGDGAQSGTYAVVLSKGADIPAELAEGSSPNPVLEAKRNEFIEKNRVVPKVFESAQTSPLELVVEPKTGATLTVDVSKH